MDDIVERIERESGVSGLASILSERVKPTDLQSLLLQVYRARAQVRSPSDVLSDFEANRFVRPSLVSPALLSKWEGLVLDHLPEDFQAIELSPVAPLGTNSVLASVSQDWAVATSRNTEVVSDPTNVLALDCALRRRELLRTNAGRNKTVNLAARHRVLRAQQFSDPQASSHFSLFTLCSAGRDSGTLDFELSGTARHAGFFARTLRAFLGPGVEIEVSVTNLGISERSAQIESELFDLIRTAEPSVLCRMDPDRVGGRGYYSDVCFKIHSRLTGGERLEIGDGGCVDWTQRLLSDAKERLVISAIGSDRVAMLAGDVD